jgi:multicomponent Na+:H+ antiporter subunit D
VLVILPIVIPLALAALCACCTGRPRLQRSLGVAGSGTLLAVSLLLAAQVLPDRILVLHAGDWTAPFGITLVADGLASIMVVMSGVMAVLMALFSTATISARHLRDGYYFLYFVLLAGVNGAFLTGDLFNLYVWFEVLLIASFVLMVLGGRRRQFNGAVKYVTMNLLGSVIFLSAVGLIYGKTGTLNMADLAQRMPAFANVPLRQAAGGMLLVAFGIKAGAFPLFSWLPASYHTPPHAVTTLFSALLTKVGVYSLIRVMTLIFPADQAYFQPILLLIAALTMVAGVLGAVAQYDMRRLLSFHIVSQIGYLLFGLALFTATGLAATIYFTVHVMAAKAALFVAGAFAHLLRGTEDLKKLGGLAESRPALALLFALPALSLAGLPPFSGFLGKLMLIQAGLDARAYVLVAVSLGVSLLTLYSMTKIWNEAFWKPVPDGLARGQRERRLSFARTCWMAVPGAILAAFSVGLSIAAQPALDLALRIAQQLLEREAYIAAVLGGAP